ncbi:peptidase S41 [Halothermothrix orenii]|uniref:Peptidase S41 n=1 Tax=Halothermothrix orenii (strain H 168 / OCM 544 / DSM 9562) TaxID=373903 RepID=B8CY78_HALOH|nr:peptidase S41 [Halothermothrix orenii]ACL70247.1 peptidase S41 [Halothermothrix orenii H 168]
MVNYRYGKNLPSFKKTTAEIINILKEKDIKKLVIDLRHNGGGSSPQGSRFARQLKNLNLDTDIYVVIGNRTFSAATINAIHFKEYTKATLIGEPTSGKPNHYGEVKTFKLPNTGMLVHYSTKYITLIDNADPDSIYPDIYCYVKFSDFVNGVDTILEKIKRL